MAHFNACEYYKKPYHYRSQKQTLWVKETVFHNKRSIATMKRDDRKLKDQQFITKQRRRGHRNEYGCPWISAITHITWQGIKHLVDRNLKPRSLYTLWREICGIVVKKGPPELREGSDLKRLFFGIRGGVNGWPFKIPP